MKNTIPLRSFTQLEAWRRGHQLVLQIYTGTKLFPPEERFGLAAHIRKTATSITSNIAEGFGRRSIKEKAHFYDIAMGSLRELQNQILIAKDLHYITAQLFQELAEITIATAKMTNALIASIRHRSDP